MIFDPWTRTTSASPVRPPRLAERLRVSAAECVVMMAFGRPDSERAHECGKAGISMN